MGCCRRGVFYVKVTIAEGGGYLYTETKVIHRL